MKRTLTLFTALLFAAIAHAADTPGYMTADETERYLTDKFQLNAPSRRYNKRSSGF